MDENTRQPIAVSQLLLPLAVMLALALAVVYAVAYDQGAMATMATDAMASSGGALHELFHDARHLVGVPCH